MSGYIHCACGGCFEIVIGEPGDYCDDCIKAQCGWYDQHGMKHETECLVDKCESCGAYSYDGAIQCLGCEYGPDEIPPKLLTTIGIDPIEYGGGIVYRDSHGGFAVDWIYGFDTEDPELDEFADGFDPDEVKIKVYTVDLHKSADEFLLWFNWASWDQVAVCCDCDPDRYSAANLETPEQRAMAVWDLASYHSWETLDQYPVELTLTEIRNSDLWGYKS